MARKQRYSIQQLQSRKGGIDAWTELSQHRSLAAAGKAFEKLLPGDQADARVVDHRAADVTADARAAAALEQPLASLAAVKGALRDSGL